MLDRGSLLRIDTEVLDARRMDRRARFIGVHKMQVAVDPKRDGLPAWLTREEALERFGQLIRGFTSANRMIRCISH